MKTIGWIGIGVGVLAVAAIGVKLYYDNDFKKTFKDANKPFEGKYIGPGIDAAGWQLKPDFKIRGVIEGDGTLVKITSIYIPFTKGAEWVSVSKDIIVKRSYVSELKIIS